MYYWNGTAWEAVAPVVPQSPIAYQASEPSSPSTGDLWIDSDQDLDSYQRQLVRYRFNPSGGATSVSGVDANGATLSYTPGAEQVYLNGALLVRGSDYVATDGTSVTSLAALSSGDVLEVFAYVAFNPANTYTQSQVDGLVAPMGLVHLNTQSFSAVSSVSLPNNIFSSTYDNYKILWNISTATVGGNLTYRMRLSGTDNSASTYNFSGIGQESGTTLTTTNISQTSGKIGEYSTDTASYSIDIFSPFLAQYTELVSIGGRYSRRCYTLYSSHGTASSFDSISLIFSAGNLTGTASVYGYKK
ncbi:MAG: hypothetical protein WAO29_01435 [Candidatus Nanopelagicales bacterium]